MTTSQIICRQKEEENENKKKNFDLEYRRYLGAVLYKTFETSFITAM